MNGALSISPRTTNILSYKCSHLKYLFCAVLTPFQTKPCHYVIIQRVYEYIVNIIRMSTQKTEQVFYYPAFSFL